MRTTLRSARLAVTDPVPIRPTDARSPALLYGIFVVGVVGFTLAAISDDGTLQRVFWGIFAVIFGLFLLYFRAHIAAATQGRVRVAEGGLRFVRTRSEATMPALVGFFGMAPGVLSLFAPACTGEVFGLADHHYGQNLFLGVVTLAGAVWLVQQAWALRLPAGLGVSALGLWGVRGGANVCLPWDDVESVSVVDSKTGARLFITSTDGTFTIQPYEIGSDPNPVAVIIEHFRTHPEDREALGDASTAIRLVEAARA